MTFKHPQGGQNTPQNPQTGGILPPQGLPRLHILQAQPSKWSKKFLKPGGFVGLNHGRWEQRRGANPSAQATGETCPTSTSRQPTLFSRAFRKKVSYSDLSFHFTPDVHCLNVLHPVSSNLDNSAIAILKKRLSQSSKTDSRLPELRSTEPRRVRFQASI